jgi:hypothetical protein
MKTMNTYHCLSGHVLTYPDPPPDVAAFLERVRTAAANPAVTLDQLIELIYGLENPLLDKTILPGRAMVTPIVFENPIYHIFGDMLFRKRLAVSQHTPKDVAATHTVSVKEAARQLGITESSVRAAITARKLAGWMRNGQWYMRPESVASYKVSNRGRKKTRRPQKAKAVAAVKTKPLKKPTKKKSISHR